MKLPASAIPIPASELLAARLDELVRTFDISSITPDPLELVLRYEQPEDREIAGVFAAAFAYGRADIVVRNVGEVLDRMGESPRRFLERFDRRRDGRRFAGFSHRFQKAPELLDLMEAVHLAIRERESLEEAFLAGDDGGPDISAALTAFTSRLVNARHLGSGRRRALSYLLPSPAGGSACKRMNLYLRWMVRRTQPDTGIWSRVEPSRLVMPIDTHVHRIATFLGLTERRSADWKTALEVTRRLRQFDPSDPVRYDFAICRLGILDLCSRQRRRENCMQCLLRDVCRFPLA